MVATMFMEKTWSETTDDAGIATLTELPPAPRVGLSVSLEGWRMPLAPTPWDADQERRQLWVDYVSGETLRLEVRMERDDEEE